MMKIVSRPAFEVVGKKVWISGQDNAQFGRFWEQCNADGLFESLEKLTGFQAGPQTGGATLGVSCVEKDPARRDFFYMLAVEKPAGCPETGLETHPVPATQWAVFESRGRMPDALVSAEIYAFSQWLPRSGFTHALAPEMEVYPPDNNLGNGEVLCEFWLPIQPGK
jgi:AraC family transcriptional regulator